MQIRESSELAKETEKDLVKLAAKNLAKGEEQEQKEEEVDAAEAGDAEKIEKSDADDNKDIENDDDGNED